MSGRVMKSETPRMMLWNGILNFHQRGRGGWKERDKERFTEKQRERGYEILVWVNKTDSRTAFYLFNFLVFDDDAKKMGEEDMTNMPLLEGFVIG